MLKHALDFVATVALLWFLLYSVVRAFRFGMNRKSPEDIGTGVILLLLLLWMVFGSGLVLR